MAVEGIRVLERYSVGFNNLVSVSILEDFHGKHIYVVDEPKLDEDSSKFLEYVYNFILGDVNLLRRVTSFSSFDEGFEPVRSIVVDICRKLYRRCKFSDDILTAVVYYILRDFVGYGEIDPFLRDPNIEDITCDGVGIPIYVFHSSYEWLETNKILSHLQLEKVVRRLAYRAGREVSVAQPIVEGILRPEGYRVHIALDTVSLRGHSFTIRRFREFPYTIVDLITRGMIDPGIAALLWLVAENRQGIIFYGPTGSGKTTLLNAIAMLIPPELKIVTVEDTPEIRLPLHDNWVSTVTRLSNDPHIQSITLQTQVESAMRQRPDILILGEIRSREAYSFFQAVSTGHGGLTTVHAESVESLIKRLVAPPMSVPKALVSTSKLFVQVRRIVEQGKVIRRVPYIHEVDDYDPISDRIIVKTLAIFNGERGRWFIDLKSSKTLRDIAENILVSYSDVIEDLYRRAQILLYAYKSNLDLVSLHILARRYRRNPEETYREVLKSLGGMAYEFEILEKVERKTI
ncbi:type II secretion system protein E [Ignisphaera aggregans DSM 17230]|uniref:Type II secretion system protein E n=1 Tax=Ignisphaera aggregans (strain DSM 17230 / JCM 13409 / AQ1.S1) TaxID=583356 RepID=E0SRS9_IGNAA|nr:type II secretion system protein E [Ignisphaera aggregans DSM 17230]